MFSFTVTVDNVRSETTSTGAVGNQLNTDTTTTSDTNYAARGTIFRNERQEPDNDQALELQASDGEAATPATSSALPAPTTRSGRDPPRPRARDPPASFGAPVFLGGGVLRWTPLRGKILAMPSIEEQKRLGMRTQDGRWLNGERVQLPDGSRGTVMHCDGMRMEVRFAPTNTGPLRTKWVRSDEVTEVNE